MTQRNYWAANLYGHALNFAAPLTLHISEWKDRDSRNWVTCNHPTITAALEAADKLRWLMAEISVYNAVDDILTAQEARLLEGLSNIESAIADYRDLDDPSDPDNTVPLR